MTSSFTREGVREYERRRYRGLDQRLVHARESRLCGKFLAAIDAETGGQLAAGGLILDLPCGYGRFSSLLGASSGRVMNSDLSFEMVFRAAETSGCPGIVADAKRGLPFRAGAFLAVFSMRLFHHIHDSAERRAVLAEFFRVSSSWAIVSYYRTNALHKAQRALRRLLKKNPRKIRLIDAVEFRADAASAGWGVVRDVPLFRGLHAARVALLRKSGQGRLFDSGRFS
ncbi:MAG: class I SAM-dependent methyltransferase [Candidatus Aminicenantes bacterium]|nr:class I SAM-dependent methyltransferase [Candidatus Aminicenantes bacterium]